MRLLKAHKLLLLGITTFLLCIILIALPFVLALKDSRKSVKNVALTNITDTAYTVTWTSDKPYKGKVYYSEGKGRWPFIFAQVGKNKAYDDRDLEQDNDGDYVVKKDGQKERYTHHVTVRNLKPEKEYSFRIGGAINGKKVSTSHLKTAKLNEDLKTPNPSYGKISNIKADDSYVILSVEGSENNIVLLSTTTSAQSTYSIDLQQFKNEKLKSTDLSLAIYSEKTFAIHSYTNDGYKPFETIVVGTKTTSSQSLLSSPLIQSVKAINYPCDTTCANARKFHDDGPQTFTSCSSWCAAACQTVGSTPTSCSQDQASQGDNNGQSGGQPGGNTNVDDCSLPGAAGICGSAQCQSGANNMDGVVLCPTVQNCKSVPNSGRTASAASMSQCNFNGSPAPTTQTTAPVGQEVTAQSFTDKCYSNYVGGFSEGRVRTGDLLNSCGGEYSEQVMGANISGVNYYCCRKPQQSGSSVANQIANVDTQCQQIQGYPERVLNTSGTSCGQEYSETVYSTPTETPGVNRLCCRKPATVDVPTSSEIQLAFQERCMTIEGSTDSRVIVTGGECYEPYTETVYTQNLQDIGVLSCCRKSADSGTVTDDKNAFIERCHSIQGYTPDPATTRVGVYPSACSDPYTETVYQSSFSDGSKLYCCRKPPATSILHTKSLLGIVKAQSDEKLTVTSSGEYVFFEDGEKIGQKKVVVTPGDSKAYVKLFKDLNANGVKDANEEYYSNYSEITLSQKTLTKNYNITSGWSLITFPVYDTSAKNAVQTASALIDDWNKQGVDIKHVAKYSNGKFEMFTKREGNVEFSNDFDLIPGEAYFIFNLGDSKTVTFDGKVIQSGVKINFSNGWNLVGFINPSQKYTSESVLKKINETSIKADTISRYQSGLYDSVIYEDKVLYGNNFDILDTQGYFVKVTEGGGNSFTP